MKAGEARKLSDEKQTTLETALQDIEQNAKGGNTWIMFPNISSVTVGELMKLGYSVRIQKDQYTGIDQHLVSW